MKCPSTPRRGWRGQSSRCEAVIKRLLHGGVVNADSLKGNNAERLHPTQKPINLVKWTMDEANMPAGAVVLDPYMGSGTTGIACLRTGRRFVGIEKDPTHYATALARITEELEGNLFHSQHNVPDDLLPLAFGIKGCSAADVPKVPQARCGTRLPRTCVRARRTFGQCRSCSATAM